MLLCCLEEFTVCFVSSKQFPLGRKYIETCMNRLKAQLQQPFVQFCWNAASNLSALHFGTNQIVRPKKQGRGQKFLEIFS